MVYLLFENNLVEPMELDECIMNTQYYEKVSDFSDLTYNEKACLKLDKVDNRDSDVESDDDEDDEDNEQDLMKILTLLIIYP